MGVVDLFSQIADNNFGFFQQVHIVGDVMTADPACLSLDDTWETAHALMRDRRIHHAPVINPDDHSVVGIVSDRDLLRHQPPLLGTAAECDDAHKSLRDSVTRFMTRGPIWCTSDCSPIHALTLMLDQHVDSILVSPDGKHVEGIITPRDFIKTLLLYHRVCTRDFDLKRLRLVDLDLRDGIPLDEIFSRGAQTVRDVMSKDPECISAEETVCAALERMQQQRVRHLPVFSGEHRYCGMLSDRDILQLLPTPASRPEDRPTRFREVLFASDDNDSLRKRIDNVMRTDTPVVGPDTLLTDTMSIFLNGSISGLPVVESKSGEICGMITTSDILRVFRVVMQIGFWASPQPAPKEHAPA